MLGRKFRLDEGHRELCTGSEQKDDLITPGLQKDFCPGATRLQGPGGRAAGSVGISA